MNNGNTAASLVGDREIAITRIFDAPRDLVWKVWTDPTHIAHWWGPIGFKNTIAEMDVRPGGVWRLVMHGPDGRDYPNKIVFIEVVQPERLVFKHVGEKGYEPVTHQTTVTFTEHGEKTKLQMRMIFPSANARDYVVKTYGAVDGLDQTIGRLGEYLAGRGRADAGEPITLRVTRRFNAGAERVFDAWLDPAHVGEWLFATPGGKMTRIEIDARVGGRFVIIERRGDVDACHQGEYLVIDRPRRLVFTFGDHFFSDPGHVQVEITPLPTGGCELTLTHEMPAKFAEYKNRTQEGWTLILGGLERVVR